MKIYLIATIRDIIENQPECSRVPGYFEDLDTAKKCIEENWGDLYEDGYYKYAVIEDVEPGLYKSSESDPIFYKWEGDSKTGKYVEIKRPVEFDHLFGFTIG